MAGAIAVAALGTLHASARDVSPHYATTDVGRQIVAQTSAPEAPRRIRRTEIWKAVYEALPDLPRLDQFQSQQARQVARSTLVQRMIRYHEERGRSLFHRFDWKLTLADYLGANELLTPGVYPASARLTPDPLEADREAIAQLNRAQRDELVNRLVQLYNPRLPEPAAVTEAAPPVPSSLAAPDENSDSSPSEPPASRPTAQPGDAQLLLP